MIESLDQKPPFIEIASEAVKNIKEPLILYGIVETIFLIFILLTGKKISSGLVPLVYVLAALVLFVAFFHFILVYHRQRMEFGNVERPKPEDVIKTIPDGSAIKPCKVRFFPRSDSPEFHIYIKELILNSRHQVYIGIGLNLLQREPLTSDVFEKAAQGSSTVEIYLADPLCPNVETRLIEEELGEIRPPIGQNGLLQRLESLLDLWEKFRYPGSISVNLFMHYPTFALLILDDDYFIYPYGYATLGNFSPVLLFSKKNPEDNPIIDFLDKQYRRIKESSIDAREVFSVRSNRSIDPDKAYQFALYFIPSGDSDFYRFGTKILGYDVRNRRTHTSQWQEYVGNACEFGFHLTLCDALFFFSESHARSAIADIKFLLKSFKSFEISGFQVKEDFPAAGCAAIKVQDTEGVLEAMEYELVQRVYRRAAASYYSIDLAPTKRDNDFKRARLMIERYKAPYILQRFYPHFTLLTQLPQEKKLDITQELKESFEKEVGNQVIRVNKVAIMTRNTSKEPWVIKEEICLGR